MPELDLSYLSLIAFIGVIAASVQVLELLLDLAEETAAYRHARVVHKGERWVLNIQPVIPFTLTEDWNLISRTILPVISQEDIPLAGDSEFGLGDVVQSLFFSPKQPTSSGIIWGVGPVVLLPTATDEQLGGEKWGIGPTGVALKQQGLHLAAGDQRALHQPRIPGE